MGEKPMSVRDDRRHIPSLRPPLPWTSTTVTRASEIGRGHWGSQAVATAVTAARSVKSPSPAGPARRAHIWTRYDSGGTCRARSPTWDHA